MSEDQTLFDEIAAEVDDMTDEELAQAAEQIKERKAREKAKMTPEKKEAQKLREKKKRLRQKEILARYEAKQKEAAKGGKGKSAEQAQ